MLLGSVPTPPRNPKSSISTQSARQSTAPAITPKQTSRGRALRKPAPTATKATTANKFTAQPWAASKRPKAATQDEMN